MIVISGALVLVALVLLVMGMLGADLPLVYGSIAVSALSLLCLLVGVLQRRGEPLPGDDDLVAVEVPARTSVRVGAAAEAERDEDVSSTQTLSHDLLSRGRAHGGSDAEDEERWQADLPEEQAEHTYEQHEHTHEDDEHPYEQDEHAHEDDEDDDAYEQEDEAYEQDHEAYEQDHGAYEQDEAPGAEVSDVGLPGVEDEGAERDDEAAFVGSGSVRLVRRPPEQAEGDLTHELAGVVLVVPGRPRYHVEGCRYLYRKQPQDLDVAEAQADGFLPCGVCRPDEVLAEQARASQEDEVGQSEEHETTPAIAEVPPQPQLRPDQDSHDDRGEQEAERRAPEEPDADEPVADDASAQVDAEQPADGAEQRSDDVEQSSDEEEGAAAQREVRPVDDGAGLPGDVEDQSPGPTAAVDPAVLLSAAPAGADETDSSDTSAEAAAAASGPAEAAATEQPAAEREAAAEGRGKKAPVENSPAKKAPTRKAPAKKAPAKKAPVAKAPAKKAPAKKAPVAKAPAKKAPADKAPAAKAGEAPAPAAPAPAAATPTSGVRRVRAVGAAAPLPSGARPAVRRVSATGAARPVTPAARAQPTPAAARAPRSAGAGGGTDEVVVIPDRARFHRASCRFVKGVPDATALSRTAAGRQGYEACGVCKP